MKCPDSVWHKCRSVLDLGKGMPITDGTGGDGDGQDCLWKLEIWIKNKNK